MCVFLLFLFQCGKRTNKKSCSRVHAKSLTKGAYFFSRKEDHFFESFLDPQISFARIL